MVFGAMTATRKEDMKKLGLDFFCEKKARKNRLIFFNFGNNVVYLALVGSAAAWPSIRGAR